MLQLFHEKEYYEAGVAADDADQPWGPTKRAWLSMARARTELIYSLDAAALAGVAKLDLPYTDRKVDNATERLTAKYVDGKEVDIGRGGEPSTQDLCRKIMAVELMGEDKRSAGILATALPVIRQMVELLQQDPAYEAVAKAEEVEAAREEYRKSVAASQAGMRAAKASEALQGRSEGRGQNGWLPYGRAAGAPPAREQPQALPGDRICSVCSGINFKGKRECYKCGADLSDARLVKRGDGDVMSRQGRDGRPPAFQQHRGAGDMASAQDDQWKCTACNADNWARRTACFACGQPKPGFSQAGGMGGSQMLPGDWECGECGFHNFKSRTECRRCGSSGGGGGGRLGANMTNVKPGDWECPECSFMNFASRSECKVCGTPSGRAAEDRSAGSRRPSDARSVRAARGGDSSRRPASNPMSWSHGGRELRDSDAAREVDDWFRN